MVFVNLFVTEEVICALRPFTVSWFNVGNTPMFFPYPCIRLIHIIPEGVVVDYTIGFYVTGAHLFIHFILWYYV